MTLGYIYCGEQWSLYTKSLQPLPGISTVGQVLLKYASKPVYLCRISRYEGMRIAALTIENGCFQKSFLLCILRLTQQRISISSLFTKRDETHYCLS